MSKKKRAMRKGKPPRKVALPLAVEDVHEEELPVEGEALQDKDDLPDEGEPEADTEPEVTHEPEADTEPEVTHEPEADTEPEVTDEPELAADIDATDAVESEPDDAEAAPDVTDEVQPEPDVADEVEPDVTDEVEPEDADGGEPEPEAGAHTETDAAAKTPVRIVDDPSRRAWHRLGRAGRPRPTKANVLATVLALGLGFAIAAQVHQTSIEGLEDLREDELIRILDTVDQDGNRLAEELQTLQLSRDRLQSNTTSLTEAQQAAQQRLDSLAIMAGTVPARGPGIVLTIRDPEFGVTAPMLLDTLQELRDAGAEAVEINDVRVVANTFFTDGEGGIAISGRDVSAPYVITAIGDGSTLASAMEIPGGVTNQVRSVGGEAGVETKDEVTVSALQTVSEPQYARPIPSPTTS